MRREKTGVAWGHRQLPTEKGQAVHESILGQPPRLKFVLDMPFHRARALKAERFLGLQMGPAEERFASTRTVLTILSASSAPFSLLLSSTNRPILSYKGFRFRQSWQTDVAWKRSTCDFRDHAVECRRRVGKRVSAEEGWDGTRRRFIHHRRHCFTCALSHGGGPAPVCSDRRSGLPRPHPDEEWRVRRPWFFWSVLFTTGKNFGHAFQTHIRYRGLGQPGNAAKRQ